jgi:hypothetical protein
MGELFQATINRLAFLVCGMYTYYSLLKLKIQLVANKRWTGRAILIPLHFTRCHVIKQTD